MLLDCASQKIARYNRFCLHYNLIAHGVYAARAAHGPFALEFEPYLIAALLAFDMGRMMGRGADRRYDPAADGFASRLHAKLTEIRPLLEPLMPNNLVTLDLDAQGDEIVLAYERIAARGPGGLHEDGDAFHVGATKLLHFLHPELFLIIDSNTAQVLQQHGGLPHVRHYSGEGYLRALRFVQQLVNECGVNDFHALEPGTPLTRIFDKIAFAEAALGD